jgi:hypothetical protein
MEFGTHTILEVIIILTYEQLLTDNLQCLHGHNVSLVGQDGSFTLHHTSLQNGSQYKDYSISTMGSAEGFLFFRGAPEGINNENVDCYSLEVKTYEITKVCSKMEIFFNRKHALPYFRLRLCYRNHRRIYLIKG